MKNKREIRKLTMPEARLLTPTTTVGAQVEILPVSQLRPSWRRPRIYSSVSVEVKWTLLERNWET